MKDYNPSDPLSIFRYSGRLINKTLSEVVPTVNPAVDLETLDYDGKGGLGMLVEKYFFGYNPNSSVEADFSEAGVELKVSPLKKGVDGKIGIKERLVCDMIDYMAIVDEEFENSRFFRKSMLMLIIFYLHISGIKRRDLEFLYSVLWQLKDKDLLIIRNDFLTIREKVRQGKAHELSEGDTLYLGACRKGQKGQMPRKQPYSGIPAPARAFSLKPAYMRTILDFVSNSGSSMASNLSESELPGIELVTAEELKNNSFEEILRDRFAKYVGMDYRQIAHSLGLTANPAEKSRYASAVRNIMLRGLKRAQDAEEIKKAGIKIKTIRIERTGNVREHMSFENIDYQEVFQTSDWVDSQWYEIVTTRYMFVIFRETDDADGSWGDETRYVLDRMFFWTMPSEDYPIAEQFWQNIRQNVLDDTLQIEDNTFWRISSRQPFHVRPKAKNSLDLTFSPVSGAEVPKRAYWFDRSYLKKEIKNAYGDEWDNIFKSEK